MEAIATRQNLSVYEITRSKIRYAWTDGRMSTATVNYTQAGRAYFTSRGRRIHLDSLSGNCNEIFV